MCMTWESKIRDSIIRKLNKNLLKLQEIYFSRYYDHKRYAAKKTQKTVEAAEKVLNIS